MSIRSNFLGATAFLALTAGSAGAGVIGVGITGVLDGPLSGGIPKLVELFAYENIADLSDYTLQVFNNGNLSPSTTWAFSGSANAGDFFYAVSTSTTDASLDTFFGSAPAPIFRNGNAFNGDDALQLFKNGVAVDSFGDIGTDGTGEPWEYTDGWAYRNDGTGPDGDTFQIVNWSFSGPNALDGQSTNAGAGSDAFPVGTYQVSAVPLPAGALLLVTGLGALALRRARKAA